MTKITSSADIARALGGVEVGGGEWKCRCPAHDDRTPSLWLKDSDSDKILVHCFSGCSQESVILALEDLKLWPEHSGTGNAFATSRERQPKGISLVWPPSGVLRKQGQEPSPENQKQLVKLYEYRDESGVLKGFTARYEGHGSKDYVPYFKNQGGKWRAGHLVKEGRALYGLELLKRAEADPESITLVICEGEKTCDALNALELSKSHLFAMTWPGGSKSVRRADFKPVSSWWRIVLSPDYDAPGYRAMADVILELQRHGFSGELFWLNPTYIAKHPELTLGFDLADLDLKYTTAETLEPRLTPITAEELRAFAKGFPNNKKSKSEEGLQLETTGESGVNGEEVDSESEDKPTPKKSNKGGGGFRIPSSGGFPHTDIGNGARFAAKFGRDLLYVKGEKSWYMWSGKVWERDDSLKVDKLVPELIDSIVATAQGLPAEEASWIIKHATKSSSIPKVDATLKAARTILSFSPKLFDAQPWLFNCKNGVVNLKTGELQSHERHHYMTKVSEINYDQEAKCPLWDKFLHRIMQGDEEMITFLQRAIGYSLTSSAEEQVLFLLWGNSGSNGKTVLCETLKQIWNDYSAQTGCELVTRDKWGQGSGSNTLARLKGARLVIGNELQEDAVLNEARVKELTGEDTVTARLLYQEFFEFRPCFKLFLRTNHRPRVTGTDGGIWRRILCIPFRAEIKGEEKDKKLQDKLKEEYPGILAWCVRGCLAWQREGLKVPEGVIRETETYKMDMDTFGDWLSECCDLREDYSESSSVLYENYVKWSKQSGESTMSRKKFGVVLRERGFLRKKTTKGKRAYLGLKLSPPDSGSLFDGIAPEDRSPVPLAVPDYQQTLGINI